MVDHRSGPSAISDRKNAEKAIWKSEEQFRTFINRHHAVMLLIDPDSGVIIDANQAATRFYGYSTWTYVNNNHPTNIVVHGSLLYADFAIYGLYKFDGGTVA